MITAHEQFCDDQATIARLEQQVDHLKELLAGKQELLDESMARNERLLQRWEALLTEKEAILKRNEEWAGPVLFSGETKAAPL